MNDIIKTITDEESKKVNWIDFTILLGKTVNALRLKNLDHEELIVKLIYSILCFAKQNNIDMNSGWNRWNTKVDFKQYF